MIFVLLLIFKLIKHIPDTEHIHNAERAVIETVSGTDVAGAFIPKVSAVVGTDISLKSSVVVRLEDIKNAGIAVAIAVARLGEVAIGEMLYVSDVSESYSVTMLANDVCNVIFGVCTKASRAKREAVVGIVYHLEEAVDALLIYKETGQTEDVPRRIVHVYCHLDVALAAGGHYSLKEIFKILPELFVVNALVSLEELVELRHSFGLPAGEGHIVLLGEVENVLCHRVVIVLDHVLFVEQSGRAVAYGVEQIGARPVEDWHKVVADDLDAEFREVADGGLIIFNVGIAGGKSDLDVVVDVDRLYDVHIEAVFVELTLDLCDLVDLPHLARHLVVERPNDSVHTGDLLNIRQLDAIVALAVPSEGHFHWHITSSPLAF